MPDDSPEIQAVRDLGALADHDQAPSDPLPDHLRARVLETAGNPPEPRSRRWSGRRTGAIAVIAIAVAGGSYATASVLTDRVPPREEVTSFANDAHIPPAAARQKLLDERKVPALADAARKRLGDAFGGVRIDNPGDLRIKLAVVGPSDDSVSRAATQAVDDSGLTGKVDIEPTTRSLADVLALQAQIDQELKTVNRGAKITVDVEPDPRGGRLFIRRTNPRSAATPQQRRFLSTVRDRYGSAVVLRNGLGQLRIGTGNFNDLPKP